MHMFTHVVMHIQIKRLESARSQQETANVGNRSSATHAEAGKTEDDDVSDSRHNEPFGSSVYIITITSIITITITIIIGLGIRV